jgi:hypothetical protein
MPGIFISYRREGASGHAGRLYDALRHHFGAHNVFMDVDNLRPGVDFVEALDQAVARADVMLVVIGRNWVDARNGDGERRLDDPEDFVRIEIQSALDRALTLIPVRVDHADMPPSRLLPEPLRPLARRHAVELRDTRWGADLEDLVRALEQVAPVPDKPVAPPASADSTAGRQQAPAATIPLPTPHDERPKPTVPTSNASPGQPGRHDPPRESAGVRPAILTLCAIGLVILGVFLAVYGVMIVAYNMNVPGTALGVAVVVFGGGCLWTAWSFIRSARRPG